MKIKSLSWILIGGVCFLVSLYAGIIIYLTWPISQISVSASGVFGDSFGPLTSLFSGLAFAGLIITIIMQRDELSLQRQELNLTRDELSGQKKEMHNQNITLRIQRFENTFFKMLELLEASRNDISFQIPQRQSCSGRDAIQKIYGVFDDHYIHSWVNTDFHSKKVFTEQCRNIDGINEKYREFYSKQYGDDLNQYFRTLYNILKLVENSDFLDDRKLYTNLLRAQLSRYELALLFYNCISDYGNLKMSPLVKKYDLLKHLDENTLPKENIDIWRKFNT